MSRSQKIFLTGIFFLSGFAGLIYESIWSHYLKLFLGHAAYAQTLVLIIFMGGMAFGAWGSTKVTHQKRINLLLAYALVEAAIGLLAIIFHSVFVSAISWSFNTVIPHLGYPLLINVFKWFIASLLIFPQCVLLGATFPLMSSGFLRRNRSEPGSSIASLYFINSLGASIGVIASGFWLIKLTGLPGTVLTAGIINIVLACLVWLFVKSTTTDHDYQQVSMNHPDEGHALTDLLPLLLTVAALTGTSSFIYEVIWIRMLSLVLGSSTHAFELMLSAFILGIALGGFYIRSHINHYLSPVKALAYVQLLMGLLAASTTLLYNHCFELMSFLYQALSKNQQGYLLFSLSSHFLASMVMLPTTFFAGMTLPLITNILIKKNHGEKSIGLVYSVNTVGSILGVILTLHLLLPFTGLKNSLMLGALLDVVLGLLLLKKISREKLDWPDASAALISMGLLILIFTTATFNLHYMASGVYRHGYLENDGNESVYHRDGKTATVDVMRVKAQATAHTNDVLSIRTNGKPDAAIGIGPKASPDEPTMRLLAFLPLSLQEKTEQIAVIGMGSGLTTHSLLAFPGVKSVDTIEIEPAMVEGAKFFGNYVSRTFNDPRNHIHLEDAKTFFTAQNKTYDLIISEPSNPWVSGVASLFSNEFYTHAQRHLTSDGVFAQWLQVYETNDQLVGSVLKAVSANFDDYQLYFVAQSDLLIVAKVHGKLGNPSNLVMAMPQLKEERERIGIQSQTDLNIRYLGNKEFFAPYLQILNLPANSDYFPVLDQNAEAPRFTKDNSFGFTQKEHLARLLGYKPVTDISQINSSRLALGYNPIATSYINAFDLYRRLQGDSSIYFAENELKVKQFSSVFDRCRAVPHWDDSAMWVAAMTISYLPPNLEMAIFKQIESQPCFTSTSNEIKTWVHFLKAFTQEDYVSALRDSGQLSKGYNRPMAEVSSYPYFMKMIMVSHIKLGQYQQVVDLWKSLSVLQQKDDDLKFLVATAMLRLQQQ